MKRNILSEVEAKRRIASQPPMAPKLTRADRIIDNSGSIEETRQQVETAWNAFLASPECTQKDNVSHGRTGTIQG